MARYYDAMDQSRILQPVSAKGSKTLCKVFWKQGEAADAPVCFGGTVEVASFLLRDTPMKNVYDRIGFLRFE